MDKAELKHFAEKLLPGVEVTIVTDSLYPCLAVAALGRDEAEEVCEHNCGWFDERINDCFNCNCPLALADKEAARQIEQIMKQRAQQVRCQQMQAAVLLANLTNPIVF
jgi:hypothetical protein